MAGFDESSSMLFAIVAAIILLLGLLLVRLYSFKSSLISALITTSIAPFLSNIRLFNYSIALILATLLN
uniref:hypothetical protein n=1 Tax=Salmonella enterica TaxID=28901 RepID=UPI00352584E0